MSEDRILRERVAELAKEADRLPRARRGSSSMLARTIDNGSYPAVAERYFACQRLDVGGDEGEGNDVTLTPVDGVLFALNVGHALPPVGTDVIVYPIRGRWVFEYRG